MELSHYEAGVLYAVSYLREQAAKLDYELRLHWKQHAPEAVYTHEQLITLGDAEYVTRTVVEPRAVYDQRITESAK